MRNLIDFLVRHKHKLVFLLLECLSLILFFRFNNYQGSVYLTTANSVSGAVYSFTSNIASYLNLQSINRQLESDNVRLRERVSALELKIRKMANDSVSINGVSGKYHYVSAQVINSTLHRNNNLMTIDKGEADGIRPEMAVVCSSGVVGITYLTSEHYTIVIPLLNMDSKVSCRLRGSSHFGTMQWQRGAVNMSYVTGIPRHAKVKKGEIVETNGFSDIFPPGIPIGQVKGIGDSSDGMAYKLRVLLFTDFKTLRNVSVITNYSKPERTLLEAKADSLTNK